MNRTIKVGVGYRRELANWLVKNPRGVTCMELTAEHFYGNAESLSEFQPCQQRVALGQCSCYVHGLGMSLGTPGPLDKQRLLEFAKVANRVKADWVSEHVAFTRTAEADLGHLNPVAPTRNSLKVMVEHAREVTDYCGKPLLLENITSHVRLNGELSEPEFLNELWSQAGCGLLLDITNLFVNSRNHGFDPLSWLNAIDPRSIRQLHIVGYSQRNGRYVDDHAKAVQPELLELAAAVVAYGSRVEAIILERDEDFPTENEMAVEISKIEQLCE